MYHNKRDAFNLKYSTYHIVSKVPGLCLNLKGLLACPRSQRRRASGEGSPLKGFGQDGTRPGRHPLLVRAESPQGRLFAVASPSNPSARDIMNPERGLAAFPRLREVGNVRGSKPV